MLASTYIRNRHSPKWQNPSPAPAEKAEKADETAYRAIEEDLKSLFATKVNLKPIGKRKKGKIEIEYYSEEDLERLLVLLKR